LSSGDEQHLPATAKRLQGRWPASHGGALKELAAIEKVILVLAA